MFTKIIYTVNLIFVVYGQQNYCNPSLCENLNRAQHIACQNTYQFAQNCISPSILEMTTIGQQFIVDLHNQLRSGFAMGQVPGFTSASRMQTLQWDNELAQLAELNAKTCKMEHDHCHNTQQYRWSGQNLGIYYTTARTLQSSDIIRSLIYEWFNEYRYAIQADTDILKPRSSSVPVIGHFTALIHDKIGRVGCAVSTFKSFMNGRIWNTMLLACNYSFANLIGEPAYRKGAPCVECRTGCNPLYPGLCTTMEIVSPNPGNFYGK